MWIVGFSIDCLENTNGHVYLQTLAQYLRHHIEPNYSGCIPAKHCKSAVDGWKNTHGHAYSQMWDI